MGVSASVLVGRTTGGGGGRAGRRAPLARAELAAAVAAVRAAVGDDAGLAFVEVERCEVSETRAAKVVAYMRRGNRTLVAVVQHLDGPARAVASCEYVERVQPGIDGDEWPAVEKLVRAYPEVEEALRRRGWRGSMEDVCADPWSVGYFGEDDGPERRLASPLIYIRTPRGGDEPPDNLYARPVDGIRMLVDLQRLEVVSFEDRGTPVIPPPDPLRNYAAQSRREVPADLVRPLRPLAVQQPEGPSFSVDGYSVAWHMWKFEVGFTPREGLVIYDVSVGDVDAGERRAVASRLSFAEMIVPYGDPAEPHFRKNAFDAGEDGLGKNAHSLRLGCDCLGHIHYFDAHLTEFDGTVRTIEQAICLHEEDVGLLWKHVDWRTSHIASRRARRLSVSFVCTVANYEYGFFFHFGMDGTIDWEVKLTGILSTGATRPGESRPWGVPLTTLGLYAPTHQHFFVARMHMCVDGPKCRLVEVNVESDAEDDPANVHGGAFRHTRTLLQTTMDARRDCSPASSRHWLVESCNRLNRVGLPTAWKLAPGGNTRPLAGRRAKILRRAGFLQHHLWATTFRAHERFPAGEFPNQNPRVGEGLVNWTAENRKLDGENGLVLWYVFGVTHVPRAEDWPVMPVEHAGFSLAPCGFFARSPAISDAVAPEASDARPRT